MLKHKKKLFFIALCITALLLTSCASKQQAIITLDTSDLKGNPLPKENRQGYAAEWNICPSSSSDGYFRFNNASKSIWYYDIRNENGLFLCAQTGCTHDDGTCQAWIGNIKCFTEYHGDIYAIRVDDSNNSEFIKKQLSTGKINVLKRWDSFEDGYYDPVLAVISNNRAILYLSRYETSMDANGVLNNGRSITYLMYDLSSGQITPLPICDPDNESCTIIGLGKNNIAVEFDEVIDEDIISVVRLYDLNTFEYTDLTDSKSGFSSLGFSNFAYGSIITYNRGKTIYLFDLDTLEEQELVKTDDTLVNYMLVDNKLIYITGEKNLYSFYYVDIDDPVPVKLENNGNTMVMQFSILYEGESFFIDSREPANIISKEDFFAERYDKAKLL